MATLRVRRLDKNHDMTWGKGSANYATTAESTAQRLVSGIREILGEWFLDTGAGVPWWQPEDSDVQPILGGRRDPSYAEAVLKTKILSIDGIDSISAFSLSIESATRKMSVQVTIVTVDGDTFNIKVVSP